MNAHFCKSALPAILLASTVLFTGCATQGKPPPSISLDEPVQAQPLPLMAVAVSPTGKLSTTVTNPPLATGPTLLTVKV